MFQLSIVVKSDIYAVETKHKPWRRRRRATSRLLRGPALLLLRAPGGQQHLRRREAALHEHHAVLREALLRRRERGRRRRRRRHLPTTRCGRSPWESGEIRSRSTSVCWSELPRWSHLRLIGDSSQRPLSVTKFTNTRLPSKTVIFFLLFSPFFPAPRPDGLRLQSRDRDGRETRPTCTFGVKIRTPHLEWINSDCTVFRSANSDCTFKSANSDCTFRLWQIQTAHARPVAVRASAPAPADRSDLRFVLYRSNALEHRSHVAFQNTLSIAHSSHETRLRDTLKRRT